MTFMSPQSCKTGRTVLALSLSSLGVIAAAQPAEAGNGIQTIATFTYANGASPYGKVAFDSNGNLFGTTYNGGAFNNGTVYEIANGSKTLTTLASFAKTNGANPRTGVTVDSRGNLFGTTLAGGDSNNGTFYEIAKGTTSIHSIASFDYTNGKFPVAGVTFDSSGNLFGTTENGGTYGYGTVYEIAQGTTAIEALDSFGVSNGAVPFGNITLDDSGNLFGTTSQGGNSNNGVVFEVARGSKTIIPLASFTDATGTTSHAGFTLDANGNLFGTAEMGGTTRNGTIFEIVKGSGVIKTFASFNGMNGSSPEDSVTFDAAGNLFGTTRLGGATGYGVVFEIASGTSQITVLDSFNTANGSIPIGGVTFDSSGNLFGTTVLGGASGAGTVYEIVGAGSPVPEASSIVSFGLLLGLGGAFLVLRKRRSSAG
jgi:uncharacterized repeat protein (TIGR03803 family)